VRYIAAGAGVRQFVDLGSGLPTRSNVHEVLLAFRDRVIMVQADLRKPASIMHHPDVLGLLDLAQPVALLCTSALHFVPDEAAPHQIIAEYRDYLASGSYLAITHANVVAAEEDPNGRRPQALTTPGALPHGGDSRTHGPLTKAPVPCRSIDISRGRLAWSRRRPRRCRRYQGSLAIHHRLHNVQRGPPCSTWPCAIQRMH
jgi:S-adenosyl methyltransferase